MKPIMVKAINHFEGMPPDRLLDVIKRLDRSVKQDQQLLAAARKAWRERKRDKAA